MDETYENNCLSAYCKNHSNMNVIRFLIENGAVINISVNNLALTLLQQPEFDNIELLEFIRNYNSSFFDSPCKLLESYNYIIYNSLNSYKFLVPIDKLQVIQHIFRLFILSLPPFFTLII